jgi:cell division protein FtsN
MQTNHSRERKKKPFFWIVVFVAVLLAGAIGLYAVLMRTQPSKVSTPVVARGKIPLPPPSPSVESPGGPSTSVESAPPTEADSPENASGAGDQSDLESPPAASVDTGPQENPPEMKSEIDAPPQEAAAGQTATAAIDELQTAVQETPESPPPSHTDAPPPSELPAADTAPAQTAAQETTAPYTIQVGAYRTKSNADRQVAQLREKGFDAYLDEKNDKDQQAWYFVRFGGFKDFGSADKALAAFKEQERMDGAIVRSDAD